MPKYGNFEKRPTRRKESDFAKGQLSYSNMAIFKIALYLKKNAAHRAKTR